MRSSQASRHQVPCNRHSQRRALDVCGGSRRCRTLCRHLRRQNRINQISGFSRCIWRSRCSLLTPEPGWRSAVCLSITIAIPTCESRMDEEPNMPTANTSGDEPERTTLVFMQTLRHFQQFSTFHICRLYIFPIMVRSIRSVASLRGKLCLPSRRSFLRGTGG